MSSTENFEEIQVEEEPFGLSCALEYFSEHAEALSMIDNLGNVVTAKQSVIERAYERFNYILGQYHEQPHLIDSHISSILDKFVSIVRSPNSCMALKHETFKYMYVVVNVRGYKVIVRHLPHEVSDFEPVLQLLEAQDPQDADTWTTRYVLLLWLSIIVLIPFHMSRLDGFDVTDSNKKTVMERVLDIFKRYAVVPDKCRDAAAFLVAKFLTRCDVKEHLSSFFEWACSESTKEDGSVFEKYGTLACVAMILKHGKREDLLPHARKLLQWVINAEFKSSSGANVQKLVYKIIQRIGMTFLPPRVVSWRYQRGSRSLAANLSAGDCKKSLSGISNENEKEGNGEDDEIDVPDEVEEVIDQLIQGLGCADSIVRWSAAKGVGRITGRLPKELADEVVGSVLEIFNRRDSDSSWHGGCLALAELGRRGLLLPQRLPEVVPVVLKALVYDEPRGYSSVGSHIRDAACYVCWSFARAYETHILKPFVNDIASTLLVVACFDKEINCRRAASAAFQENVGRQGTFPHGIEILTAADFYAVSVRKNAYLNVSTYIAQFEEYREPLIEHLIHRKVDHWDCSIRELTSKALHNLAPAAPTYMFQIALPQLFTKAKTIDLNARHGAVLAIGEILNSLSTVARDKFIENELLDDCKTLIPIFQERLYFRGLGGELMRQACSSFIQNCSLAKLPFHGLGVIETWFSLLNDCIAYDVPHIRTAAISALPSFISEYYKGSDPTMKAKRCKIIDAYIRVLKSVNTEMMRMGHALALGALPAFMLKDNLNGILNALISATYTTPETLKWAESRRDAAKAITSICVSLDATIKTELSDEMLNKIYDSFLNGLKEYTLDNRGDIGAWMREASMTGLETVTFLLNTHKSNFLTETLVTKIITGIGQQAVEKIDRTRALAGKIFYNLIHSVPSIPNIPNHEEVKQIITKTECDMLNWNSAADTFPKFVNLLQYHVYTYNTLLGLICSVGGMTETLVKNASSSLFAYLTSEEQKKGSKEITRYCDIVYNIFCDYQKVDRVTVPMLRFLDKLMSSACIRCIFDDSSSEFPKKVLKLVQAEVVGCKDIYKLIDGISVFCQFIQLKNDVAKTALVQLSILLCHRQTYVRRSTSAKLYESLLLYGDNSVIPMDNLDEIMDLLSTTNWEEPVDSVKPIRNNLCILMGISVPVPKKKT